MAASALCLSTIALVVAVLGPVSVSVRFGATDDSDVPTGITSSKDPTLAPATLIAPQPSTPNEPRTAPVPIEVAARPSEGLSDVLIYDQGDTVYAHSPKADLWFRIAATGDKAEAVPLEQVPAALLSGAVAPRPSATVSDTAEAERGAERAIAQAGDTDPELEINMVLSDPMAAAKVLEVVAALPGVDVPGEAGSLERPVSVFFDPRCPYCHAAFAALDGRVAMRWIPVLTLDDPKAEAPSAEGQTLAATLLGQIEVSEKTNDGVIRAVAMAPETDRADQLRGIMTGSARPEAALLSDVQRWTLDQNKAALIRLYGEGQQSLLAVPTFLVPQPDGTAVMIRGMSDDNIEAIVTAMGSQDGADPSRDPD